MKHFLSWMYSQVGADGRLFCKLPNGKDTFWLNLCTYRVLADRTASAFHAKFYGERKGSYGPVGGNVNGDLALDAASGSYAFTVKQNAL